MAFSLKDIPRVKEINAKNGQEKRKIITSCYGLIKGQDKVTETIREALKEYLTERLERTSTTNLSIETLQANIIELLEFCCKKNYKDIVLEDVIKHEREILQQISWCMEYRNTKRLIFNEEEYEVFARDSRDMGKVSVYKEVEDVDAYLEMRRKYYGK